MPEENAPFQEPRLALNRIYTRTGDTGETALVGGQRVEKDALRIECYGTVDELNSFVGMARHSLEGQPALEPLSRILWRVQHELFNLGSILATLPEDVGPQQPRVTPRDVAQLEQEIDEMNDALPPLRSFVLPGGSRVNTELHACRTICRRAERIAITLNRYEPIPPEAIHYLNRLSDALFVYSRWVNATLGVPESLWDPNQSATGQ